MSKYKCKCGFDDGTEKGVTDHIWEHYKEMQRQLREGEITLEQFRAMQDKTHGASWCNSSCCAHLS